MKITDNLHIGLSQINNPSPEKFKFFVNATILIFGLLITPTIVIIKFHFPEAISQQMIDFLKDFMLIFSGFLKGFEKLLGKQNSLYGGGQC